MDALTQWEGLGSLKAPVTVGPTQAQSRIRRATRARPRLSFPSLSGRIVGTIKKRSRLLKGPHDGSYSEVEPQLLSNVCRLSIARDISIIVFCVVY